MSWNWSDPIPGGWTWEDITPVSDTQAFVSIYRARWESELLFLNYEIRDNVVRFSPENGKVKYRGKRVRVGNVHDGWLYFSDRDAGVWRLSVADDETQRLRKYPLTAHQPFMTDGGLYYSDNLFRAKIYYEGELFLDSFAPYIIVGNVWIDKTIMLFEATKLRGHLGWELWAFDLSSRKKAKLPFDHGANPTVYGERLFWSDMRNWPTHAKIVSPWPITKK